MSTQPENASTPAAATSPAYPPDRCATCHRRAGQLRAVGDGPFKCESCHESEQLDRLEAERAAIKPAFEIPTRQPSERSCPRRIQTCDFDEAHFQRPAVGFRDGSFACDECMGESAPAKLLERIAHLEAQQGSKASRKAVG